jgi:hypothetical protein
MKKIVIVCIAVFGLSLLKADAQYVRSKPSFSVGISIGQPGPPPYSGAYWVAPEWRWRHGRYVEVRGHWMRSRRHHSVWISGEWVYTNRGYRWRPGYWR